MKKHYYIISALGFAAVVLAAMASDAGTDLPYTIPPAVIGALLLWYGIARARRIRRRTERIHRNRAEIRRGLGRV